MNGNFAYSFILGVVAAVNPCGFAMLPAYLAYFVGVDQDSPRAVTDRLARALRVGLAVSSGFVVVFVIVGVLVRSLDVFDGLPAQARWAGLVVGILMVVAGVAMVFGWNPQVRTPGLAGGARSDRSARSMVVFGVAYAVASIGCTIGLFLSVILGSFTRDGIVGGVLSTAAYGAGMGMLVTGLTIAIALTRTGVSDRLRSFSRHVHTIAGVVVVLSGAYLAWYWYGAIFRPTQSNVVTATVGACALTARSVSTCC